VFEGIVAELYTGIHSVVLLITRCPGSRMELNKTITNPSEPESLMPKSNNTYLVSYLCFRPIR